MTKALTFRENLALQRRGIEADAIPDEILQKFVEDLIAADEPPATTRTVRVVKRDDASPVATTATDPPETTRSLLWRALELDVKEFRAHDPTLTEAQAIVKAMERHPTLVRAYEAAAASGEPPEWDPPARVEKACGPDVARVESSRDARHGEA